MKKNDFKNKKVTVFGLGLSGGGVGVAKFFCEAGARVTVTDIKTKQELKPSIEQLKGCKNIRFVFDQHHVEDFTNVDLIVKSPPISWDHPYIKRALERKIPVEGDSSLFFKLCPVPIIGITGTKGKTTTASLIYEILKKAGKNPIKVGISQVSVLDKLFDIKKENIIVFELSSWRLSALKKHKMSPHVAVITNVLRDHLNYYKTMEKYIADKKNIFLYQKPHDICVINWDDPLVRDLAPEVPSDVIRVSLKRIPESKSVYAEKGTVCLDDGKEVHPLVELDRIRIKGKHNIKNTMLAIGATFSFGVKAKHYQEAIEQFAGVAHRLEFVREVHGVKYYNDSAATIPEAAVGALGAFLNPVILICGGTDKGLDFKNLAWAIHDKAKGVIFLKGTATEKIISELKKLLTPEQSAKGFEVVDSMKKAVEIAARSASAEDIVLLSPGAASFGIFKNEFDRGNQFKEEVKLIK